MIMRTVLTFAAIWCVVPCLAGATTTTTTTPIAEVDEIDGQHQEQSQEVVDSIMQQLQRAMKDPSGTEIQKLNVTEIATKVVQEYVTPSICSYTPEFCAKTPHLQSRGIQSYLATAGTMFAGTLGVMMTKITILIVLSLVSMIVGKMLLFYAFITSKHYHHDHHEHISHHGHHSHPHFHGYHHGHHHGYHHKHSHGHHHHVPYVKYTKDKYYIKHTPVEQTHEVVESPQPSLSSYQSHSSSPAGSTGVSYYKR